MNEIRQKPTALVTETGAEARQGRSGRPVLKVLIGSLVLATIVWAGVELWGESIDSTDKPQASASANDPINVQPSGRKTFNDNPADGSSRPATAIDRSPTPSGNAGGPTQVTTPTGTEKTQ